MFKHWRVFPNPGTWTTLSNTLLQAMGLSMVLTGQMMRAATFVKRLAECWPHMGRIAKEPANTKVEEQTPDAYTDLP
jgi:hypothetical protein